MNQRDDAVSEQGEPTTGRRKYFVVLLFVALLAGILFFWKLGTASLENWDEGIHAEVSREMYRNGSWLSMSYRDSLYTAKPPLKFWMTTALFPLFGETEFAVRFWSALAGVATTILIAVWAWQWTRRYSTTLVAAATFLFSQLVLFHAFRTGETDGLFLFIMTAALYSYWRSREHRRWFVLFGALTGIAIMVKSVAGLLPPLIVAIDLTAGRRWRAVGFSTIIKASGIALLIAAPWHLYETFRYGATFWKSYIGFHVVDRAIETLYANNVSWWWYADVVFRRTYPYKFLIPFALLLGGYRALRARDALDRLLLIAVLVVFAVVSAMQTKFAWYVLPLLPPAALLAGRAIQEAFEGRRRWIDGLLIFGFFGSMFILPTGIDRTRTLWRVLPHAYLPTWFSATTLGRAALAFAATAILCLFALWVRRYLMRPHAVLSGIVLSYLFLVALGWQIAQIRSMPSASPLEHIAAAAQGRRLARLDAVGVDLLRQPAGYFYLRRSGATIHELPAGSAPTSDYVLTTAGDETAKGLHATRSYLLQEGNYLLFGPIDSSKP